MATTTSKRLGVRALFAATALAIAQPAWALTCEEIMSMVGFNMGPVFGGSMQYSISEESQAKLSALTNTFFLNKKGYQRKFT